MTARGSTNEGGSGPRLGYRPALDGLRGVAMIAVLTYHAMLWPPGAVVAIDTFFPLSGFLITTLLLEEKDATGRMSLKRFYARRALRLLPAVTAMLIAYSLLALVTTPEKMALRLKGAAIGFGYAANWVIAFATERGVFPTRELGHLWSLSLEEQFYIVWPPILVLGLALGLRRLSPALLGMGAVAFFAWRFYKGLDGASDRRLYFSSDMRFDEILMGCALAFGFRAGWLDGDRIKALLRVAIMPAVTLLLVLPFTLPVDMPFSTGRELKYRGVFSLAAAASVVLISWVLVADDSRVARVLKNKVFVTIGILSYSIYVWHVLIMLLLREYAPAPISTYWVWWALPLSLAGGALSYRYIEKPFLRLKDRKAGVKRAKDPRPLAA